MVSIPGVPLTVSKLANTITPCAPSIGKERGKGQGNWTCLRQDEASAMDKIVNKLDKNTSQCAYRDDGCKLNMLKKSGVYVDALEKKRLRPRAPRAWLKTPTTWLMTSDFEMVLRQYEEAYPEFVFLGASPIDFDKPLANSCVWPRMCQFNLKNAAKDGKTKIGMIFNEDNHNQKGSHWICAFLDVPKKVFYFIDSVGNPVPKEVKDFAERLSKECEELYGKKIELIVSTMPHQRGNNQCGMYCLFFIICLLTETATYKQLMNERIPDGAMHELRKFLFRHTLNIKDQVKKTRKKEKRRQRVKGKSLRKRQKTSKKR